jgi:hypothetical protein
LNSGTSGLPLSAKTAKELGEKRVFVFNEDKASVVRSIADMALQGLGCQSIARSLNLQNVECLRGGSYWQPRSVYSLLSNETLCGRYVHDDVVIENYFPAIVTPEQFNEISLMLDSKKNAKQRGGVELVNPLSSLCYCSVCNSKLTRVSARARRGRQAYEKLVCAAAKVGKCKFRSIAIDEVFDAVKMLIGIGPDGFPDMSVVISDGSREKLVALQRHKADLDLRIDRLTTELGLMGGSEAIRKALAGLETEKASV